MGSQALERPDKLCCWRDEEGMTCRLRQQHKRYPSQRRRLCHVLYLVRCCTVIFLLSVATFVDSISEVFLVLFLQNHVFVFAVYSVLSEYCYSSSRIEVDVALQLLLSTFTQWVAKQHPPLSNLMQPVNRSL